MDAQFWQQKWDEGKIGFHQEEVNKRLVTFWPDVITAATAHSGNEKSCIFVPLCGKSLDMLWLHQQGHAVLGIELSQKAVQAFFDDNQLACEKDEIDGFQRFTGSGKANGLTLLAGDFFKLTPPMVAHCNTLYDRAATIAMPPDMRGDYTGHLAMLMRPGSRGLLVTISYDQSQMDGPPFSVTDGNVRELLSKNFDVTELAHHSGPERVGNLAERGLETLDERVYLLSRKPPN